MTTSVKPFAVLYVIVVEALSCRVRSGCLRDLLYDDGLAWVSESLEDLKWKLERLERTTGDEKAKNGCSAENDG